MNTDSFDDFYIPSILNIPASQHMESPDYDYEGAIINDQYRIEHILTGGSLGRVFKCLDIATGMDTVFCHAIYPRGEKGNKACLT